MYYTASPKHLNVPVREAKRALDMFWRDVKKDPPHLNWAAFHHALEDSFVANDVIKDFDPIGRFDNVILNNYYTRYHHFVDDPATRSMGMALIAMAKAQKWAKSNAHGETPWDAVLDYSTPAPVKTNTQPANDVSKTNEGMLDTLMEALKLSATNDLVSELKRIAASDELTVNISLTKDNKILLEFFPGAISKGDKGYILTVEFDTDMDPLDLKQIFQSDIPSTITDYEDKIQPEQTVPAKSVPLALIKKVKTILEYMIAKRSLELD